MSSPREAFLHHVLLLSICLSLSLSLSPRVFISDSAIWSLGDESIRYVNTLYANLTQVGVVSTRKEVRVFLEVRSATTLPGVINLLRFSGAVWYLIFTLPAVSPHLPLKLHSVICLALRRVHRGEREKKNTQQETGSERNKHFN